MIPAGTPGGRVPLRSAGRIRAVDLVRRLDAAGVTTRELARRLDVSPMWVSRRTTGEVLITTDDATRIEEALDTAPA